MADEANPFNNQVPQDDPGVSSPAPQDATPPADDQADDQSALNVEHAAAPLEPEVSAAPVEPVAPAGDNEAPVTPPAPTDESEETGEV